MTTRPCSFDKEMLVEFEIVKAFCQKNDIDISKTTQFIQDAINATTILESRYAANVLYETEVSSITDIADRVVHQWNQSISIHHEFLESYDIMRRRLQNAESLLDDADT